MDTKFNCTKCGECCKGFADSKPTAEENEFLESSNAKILPLALSSKRPIVFGWERKRMQQIAKDIGAVINFRPMQGVFDTKTNKAIILFWGIDHEQCPFLSSDNMCKIYEKRPMVCKAFPPIFNTGLITHNNLIKLFPKSICPEEFPEADFKSYVGNFGTVEELWQKMYARYGREYFYAVQRHHVENDIHKFIHALITKGAIMPLVGKNLNILEKIKSGQSIDFFDFLIENKIRTQEQVNQVIEKWESLHDFTNLIEKFDQKENLK